MTISRIDSPAINGEYIHPGTHTHRHHLRGYVQFNKYTQGHTYTHTCSTLLTASWDANHTNILFFICIRCTAGARAPDALRAHQGSTGGPTQTRCEGQDVRNGPYDIQLHEGIYIYILHYSKAKELFSVMFLRILILVYLMSCTLAPSQNKVETKNKSTLGGDQRTMPPLPPPCVIKRGVDRPLLEKTIFV